jgi:hypothetical protein
MFYLCAKLKTKLTAALSERLKPPTVFDKAIKFLAGTP